MTGSFYFRKSSPSPSPAADCSIRAFMLDTQPNEYIMEAILRNKKLNDLLNLIETDLDLAKDNLLESKRLFNTIIEIGAQLSAYIGPDMSVKQSLELKKIKSQINYMHLRESVTYQRASQDLKPLKNYIVALLEEGIASVPTPDLVITSDIVTRALQDAQTLTIKNGAPRGLDRLHTAFHGYLRKVCDDAKIPYPDNSSITQLWKELRENHPVLNTKSSNKDKIDTIVKSISNVVDAFNQMRNQASPAHPNETLEKAEAIFVINTVNTVLSYLNMKFKKINKSYKD